MHIPLLALSSLVTIDLWCQLLLYCIAILALCKVDPVIRVQLLTIPILELLHKFSTGGEYRIISHHLQLGQPLLTHYPLLIKQGEQSPRHLLQGAQLGKRKP